MENEKLLTNNELKQIVGATLGVSAMLFVVGYLESTSVANGLFWKIVRRLGITGLGLATMQLVDKYAQEYADEQITYYSSVKKSKK